MPVPDAIRSDVNAAIEAIVRLAERNPDASGPVPREPPRLVWPPQGIDLKARAQRRFGESLSVRKAKVLAWTLLYYLIVRFKISVGRFSPSNT